MTALERLAQTRERLQRAIDAIVAEPAFTVVPEFGGFVVQDKDGIERAYCRRIEDANAARDAMDRAARSAA